MRAATSKVNNSPGMRIATAAKRQVVQRSWGTITTLFLLQISQIDYRYGYTRKKHVADIRQTTIELRFQVGRFPRQLLSRIWRGLKLLIFSEES